MINFLRKIISYLFFGLKSADDNIFTQKESGESENSSINIVNEERNVYKDIKKGEVTQEVENLRYSTYNVYRESNKYQYLGDGIANKKEQKEKTNNYNFTLHNNLICDGVLDSLNKIDSNNFGFDKYTLSIQYKDIPRFRLERFCKMIEVSIEENIAKIKLHFSAFYDKYDSTSKSFLNEMNKINDIRSYYEINKNEICSNISNISFTTYKANGEDDMISYSFNNLEYLDFYKDYFEYVITYKSESFSRIDILDKYYSYEMDKKYSNKDSKTQTLDLVGSMRKTNCDVCGMEMPVYDYDITKETFGYSICNKCLEDTLKNEKK